LSDVSASGVAETPARLAYTLTLCTDRLIADLVLLLQLHCLELIAFEVAMNSVPYNGNIVFCSDLSINEAYGLHFSRLLLAENWSTPALLDSMAYPVAGNPIEISASKSNIFYLRVLPDMLAKIPAPNRAGADQLPARVAPALARIACAAAVCCCFMNNLMALKIASVGFWSTVVRSNAFLPPQLVSEMLEFSLNEFPHAVSQRLPQTESQHFLMTDYSDPLNPQFSGVGLCAVCGLTATGVHYGAATCNACKAFFKRTVHSCLTYLCASSTDGQYQPFLQDPKQQSPLCPVNNASRKQCPACRWRRCLMSGMQPGMLRTVAPGTESERYPRLHRLSLQPPGPLPEPPLEPPPRRIKQLLVRQLQRIPALTRRAQPHRLLEKSKANCVNSQWKTSTMGEDFLSVEPRELAVIVLPCLDAHSARLVQFAKDLPGFSRVAMPDRIRLLQAHWAGLVSFELSMNSVPFTGLLYFAANVCVPPGRVSAFNSSLAMRASQQIRLTARLLTSGTSVASNSCCLKAIFMLQCPPGQHFDNPDEIDKLQSTFLRELRRICPDVVRRGKIDG
uniref:Nuclear receptor domain-containing protein n=1 Tax=Macrostomum lignano TaxID=282301 RepID=A0A1I8JM97_9PLAT